MTTDMTVRELLETWGAFSISDGHGNLFFSDGKKRIGGIRAARESIKGW